MLYLFTLFAFVAINLIIFAVPLRMKSWVSLALTAVGSILASAKAITILLTGEKLTLWVLNDTPFGRDSGSMDELSALFVLVISIGSIVATLYSKGYLEHYLSKKSPAHISLHYVSLTLMSLAMLFVVMSDGGFSFLFFWELMTIASFILILFDAEKREVQRAAMSYLIMMHIGFVLLLVGFVRLHVMTGDASFMALSNYLPEGSALPLYLVFVIGFGMKAGLFPLHVWLPEAHPAAPSHVSALMSGVMIKTGIYGILRVTAAITQVELLHTMGIIILTLGIATGLWGVILAAAQNDMKRLLAYSSIENIGVILIGLGIALLGKYHGNTLMATLAIAGTLLHIVNHSFFKSLLFMGAGNVLSKVHTTSLDKLGGMFKQMPITALLFLVGVVAICALPPLNGFVSELLIYMGMLKGISTGSEVLLSVVGLASLALIGGIVVIACTKLYGIVFLGSPRTHEVVESSEVDNLRIAAMSIPLAGILLIGLFPQGAVNVVLRGASFFLTADEGLVSMTLSPMLIGVCRAAWLLVGIIALLAFVRHRLLKNRRIQEGPTWGCGFMSVNTRMQYTGESFSEGLQSIARPLTHNFGEGESIHKGEIFAKEHKFHIHHRDRIGRLFSAWWVGSLSVINSRVMRLRTGKINHYILFALAFLGVVFLLSIFNLI